MCLFDVYRGATVPEQGGRAPAPAGRAPVDEGAGPARAVAPERSAAIGERECAWLGAIAAVMAAAAADLGPESAVGRRLADGAVAARSLLSASPPALRLVPTKAEAASAGDAPR
jgi:hypothetical protein